jgi:glycosyltransferase involved in cell wall biosynthesis
MKVLALANLYRPQHLQELRPYRRLNPAASSWNTALFDALAPMGLELHVAQFLPIRRALDLRDGGIHYHYLPRVPGVDGVSSVLKRQRLRGLIRRLRPDVLHGIGSEHGYAWPVVAQGVPSAVTVHGYLKVINGLAGHRSWLKENFLVREEARALRSADAVLAINEFMRENFVQAGCPAERIHIVANALNPVYLQQWQEERRRDIDLIMVGTLHPLKNHNVALQLLQGLSREHGLRPRVLVVGTATTESAAYAEGLKQQARAAGLEQVEFVGKKSPAELVELYRRSRFLLHISSFEADPTVVAEALACGAVPVVNPVAGLAFRVQDNANGWHLPIADVGSATLRLAQLLAETTRRDALAAFGRDAVLQQRRPQAVAQATLDVYRRLATRG